MDAVLYVDIIGQTLLPFLDTIYPDGHHLMQGNDPKHTSNHCKDYFKKTPLNQKFVATKRSKQQNHSVVKHAFSKK